MQEDAHECLRYILDGLQNEALRPYKREQLRILRKQQKGDESAAKPLMKQVHVPMGGGAEDVGAPAVWGTPVQLCALHGLWTRTA